MEDSIEYRGLTYRIVQDEDPLNPRTEYDNAATMYCEHRNYDLGDEKAVKPWENAINPRTKDYYNEDEASQFIDDSGIEAMPLYLYDHSGITMRTGPFGDPWDSGCVGFIFMTKETIAKECGYSTKRNADGSHVKHKSNRVTQAMRRKAREIMESEVKVYDQYLTGDVYGYIVYNVDGDDIDSCWGFYGSDYCEDEAKSVVDYLVNHAKPFQM